jgi:head-tail adaptor
MEAGRLDRRLEFQAPFAADNGAGTYTQGYAAQFECAANIIYLRGGETVIASRLEQKSPVVLTIRNAASTRRITGEWRARDVRTDVVYAIKEPPRESEDRAFVEMLATSGVQV